MCAVRIGDTWDEEKGKAALEEMIQKMQFENSFEDLTESEESK